MISQQTIANFGHCTGKKDYLKQLIKTKQHNQLNSGLTGIKKELEKPCLIFSSRVVCRSGQHLAKWVRKLLHAQLEL